MSLLKQRIAEATAGRTAVETVAGYNSHTTALAADPFLSDRHVEIKRLVAVAVKADLATKLTNETPEIERDAIVQGSITAAIDATATAQCITLTQIEVATLIQEIAWDISGLGPLEPLLADTTIDEIMVNGPYQIYVERSGLLYLAPAVFNDEPHLRNVIERIVGRVGRRIDESSPMVDARLPDGSRVNAVIPPLTVHGSSLTIRKFAKDPYTIDDLITFGTLTPAAAAFLRDCVIGKMNILISGGTGSGKTTMLNVLTSFIPETERIVTIEDAAELQPRQTHVVALESRPANAEGSGRVEIRELVRNALRMRPDRIVVGEVRDGAVVDMLQAMNTGHDGSLSTVHANSPRDATDRIETMYLSSGVNLPSAAIRKQTAAAVDLIVQVQRIKGGRRLITRISEVIGIEGDVITMQDIFLLNSDKELVPAGIVPAITEKIEEEGVEVDRRIFAVNAYEASTFAGVR